MREFINFLGYTNLTHRWKFGVKKVPYRIIQMVRIYHGFKTVSYKSVLGSLFVQYKLYNYR